MAEASTTEHNMDVPRGYKPCILQNVSDPDTYLCGLCRCILRAPSQVECGHQFCEPCLQHALRISAEVECPPCQADSERMLITKSNIQPDYACRKLMQKLSVRCENQQEGCTWCDLLQNLDYHLGECEYAGVRCPDCHEVVQRRHLADHSEHECLGGPLDVSSPCSFGCRGLSPDVNIDQHNIEYQVVHVETTKKEIDKLTRFTKIINKLHDRIAAVLAQGDLEGNSEQTELLDEEVNEVKENLQKMDVSTKASTGLINHAFKEVQRLATRLVELEKSFQVQFMGVGSGELAMKQQEINQLQEQLVDMNTSHDGVLLWEITGVAEKIKAAKENGTSLNSPVFYTSRGGYAMMARIYFNGDGPVNKDHFISLFIVVLKGKYDGTLSWPLKQLVCLTLFDQSGGRKHHKYSFCTNASSSSFARPQQAANIASGSPRFISQQEFNQRYDHFVQEDEIILEVRVGQDSSSAY